MGPGLQPPALWRDHARGLLELLDRIAGTTNSPSPQVRRAARTTAASLLMGSGAAAVLAVVYAALGSPLDALVGVTSSCGAAGLLGVWRLTGRQSVATHGTLGFFITTFCVAAHLTGSSAYLSWVAVVVLVSFYSGGLRLGAYWTVAAMVALAIAGPLVDHPPDLGLGWTVNPTELVPTLRAMSLVPVIALLGAASELTRLAYIRELELARLEAERANAARARLMAKVSHEIRTPLNGILGLTEATLLGEVPSAVRADIEAVRASGKVLMSLVNDLLDVARAEAGQLAVVAEPLDVRDVVDEVVALHRASATQKGLRVEVTEAGYARPHVLGDEVRLRQVLGNLLSNAIKFTRAGRVELGLEARPAAQPEWLELILSVTDTGPGMSESDRTQLFTPFFQVRAEDQHTGTGLGLAICQELVHRMGGTIEVESTLGVGSCFRVRLTLASAPAPRRASQPQPPRAVEPTSAAAAPGAARTALVVDDNAVNLRVATALLGRLGVAVTAVSSGQAALDRAWAEPFDLVITDLQMPELDGFETARRLRAGGFTGPIIALTASAEPTIAEDCRVAGLDGCLTKPVSLAALRALLEDLGGAAGARDAEQPPLGAPSPACIAARSFADASNPRRPRCSSPPRA